MKILHAIQGLPVAAGTTTFVVGMANELSRMGHEVSVAVYCNPSVDDKNLFVPSVRLFSIPQLLQSNAKGDYSFDVVHIHSMWNVWLHRVAAWCRRHNVLYVCSPHGSATEWALHYKYWKKRLAWFLYQRKDFAGAEAFHVTVEDEASDVRRLGLSQDVIVAPLGVNLPQEDECARPERKNEFRFLFVSRVQKKKGLVNLVRAVAKLNASGLFDGERRRIVFRIVGPDQEGHTAELNALAKDLGVEDSFDFVGPRYGAELSNEYKNADVFVLPTFSENFGVVIIDALAHRLPVITTKGAPWRELEEWHCGWWVEIGVEPLANALLEILKMPPQTLTSMGSSGRLLVKERYSWAVAAGRLLEGYSRIVVAANGRRAAKT